MKDYYYILNIPWDSDAERIKSAYYELARTHHPDVSSEMNATKRMQDINEAYYILKDSDKRMHYDSEYHVYREWLKECSADAPLRGADSPHKVKYDVKDHVLRRWMDEAAARASALGKQALRDTGNMAAESVKEGAQWLVWGIFAAIIMSVMTQCMVHK